MGVIGGVDLLAEIDRDDLGQDAIVEGLIFTDTINMIYSEPGAGKSVIALNMMASMSRGLPVFGMFKMKKEIKCSFLQLEGSRIEQLARLKSIREKIPFNAMNIFWHDTPLYVESLESIHKTFKELNEVKPEHIFIDSFYCLTNTGLSKESSFLPVRQLVKEIKDRTKSAITILHHSAKPSYFEGKRVEIDDPFLGSQYMKAFLDMTIFLKRIDRNRCEMEVKKESRNAEGIKKITLNFNRSSWLVTADEKFTTQPAYDLIRQYLKEKFLKGLSVTTLQICEELDMTPRHVRRLKADGYFDDFVVFEEGGHGKGNATKWQSKS